MNKNEKASVALVHIRADGLCERCGRQGHTLHHRKNRSQGGRWTTDNIVLLCGDGTQLCHGWVTTHPKDAAAEGFHLRSWEDPADIPILLHRVRRVCLTPDSPEYHEVIEKTCPREEDQ